MFVLAPIHNPRHWDNLIRQFEQQELVGKRLIVVSDGFRRPLPSHPAVVAYDHQPKRRGIGAARNKCVELARKLDPKGTGIAAFFDADDKYRHGWLLKVRKALQEHPECAAVGMGEFYERSQETKGVVLVGEGSANQYSNRGMAGGTLGFHLKHCVPFSETVQTGEDTVWCRDMREAGHKLWSMDNPRPKTEELGAALSVQYLKCDYGPSAGHTHPRRVESPAT